MIYKTIKGPTLSDVVEQVNQYFAKYDPKLYDTQVIGDFEKVCKDLETWWIANLQRDDGRSQHRFKAEVIT